MVPWIEASHGIGQGFTLELAFAGIVRPAAQVGDAGAGDGAAEGVGLRTARRRGKGGKAAVGIAVDGDMALARQALRHQPGGRVVIVVRHLQAVLVVAGTSDLFAPTGRGAVLRLHDDVAARREIFRPAGEVPAPGITRPRAAVRGDDRRVRPCPPDRRVGLGDIGRQDQAVARRILHDRRITQVVGHDLRTRLAEQGQPLALDIDVIFRRGLGTRLLDDQRLAVLAERVDAH